MQKVKTVGIIGGGLSGLAAATFLARQGYRAKLFEANGKVGGCCATTELQGFSFNDGAMYIAIPGILDHAFERLGLDRTVLIPLRQIIANQNTTLSDGTVINIGHGRDIRICGENENIRQARLDIELDHLLSKWEPVLRLLTTELIPHPFSVWRLLWKGGIHLSKFHGTVASELNAVFSDPAVRAAMAGVMHYTGLPPEKTPVLQILGLVSIFSDGFFLPEGGMGMIPKVLTDELVKQNGEIFTGAKVEKIELTNGRVSSLRLDRDESIPVDAVISTVSGMLTLGLLADVNSAPSSMVRKMRKVPLSHKALCVQLGLSNCIDVPSHSMSHLPMMEDQYKVFLPSDTSPEWLNYTVPTVTMPELAPPGGSIIEMFPPINQLWPADRWDDEAKNSVAEKAICALSERHSMDVVAKRITSPRDYQVRMHLFDGAVYGLSPAADVRFQFPHKTPIAGLYQAGQTTYPGYGVGPAIMSGIFAAECLIKET